MVNLNLLQDITRSLDNYMRREAERKEEKNKIFSRIDSPGYVLCGCSYRKIPR